MHGGPTQLLRFLRYLCTRIAVVDSGNQHHHRVKFKYHGATDQRQHFYTRANFSHFAQSIMAKLRIPSNCLLQGQLNQSNDAGACANVLGIGLGHAYIHPL